MTIINGFEIKTITDILEDGKIYSEPGLYPAATHVADITLQDEKYKRFVLELHSINSIEAYKTENIPNATTVPMELEEYRDIIGANHTIFKIMNDDRCRMEHDGYIISDVDGELIRGESYNLKIMYLTDKDERVQIPKYFISDDMLYGIYREYISYIDDNIIEVYSFASLVKYFMNNKSGFTDIFDYILGDFEVRMITVNDKTVDMIYDTKKIYNKAMPSNPFFYGAIERCNIPEWQVAVDGVIVGRLSLELENDYYIDLDTDEYVSLDEAGDIIGALDDDSVTEFFKSKSVKNIPIFTVHVYPNDSPVYYSSPVSYAFNPKTFMTISDNKLIELLRYMKL